MSDKRVIGQHSGQDADFDEMLAASGMGEIRFAPGDSVNATVVRVGRDYIFLDLGSRAEGLLDRSQVTGPDGEVTLKVGERVKVIVSAFKEGAILCALRLQAAGAAAERRSSSDKDQMMSSLKEAFDAGMPVEGVVKESVKGGFSINILGARAFCPISQIDNKFTETPDVHVGHTYTFEIIKFEEGGRNLVVSRRKLLERDADQRKAEAWRTLSVGQTFEGTVSSLRPFGAFVDIDGVEGLLHVSEISYDRIGDPSEVLSVGQKVKVAIKDLDEARGRISLSLKALLDDPWDKAAMDLKVQGVYKGKVVRIAQFGAFVELTPGVDGLVHISQLGAEQRVRTVREVVKEGDEVTVKILEIDPTARRISLTLKLEDSPEDNWREELAAANVVPSKGMGTLGDLLKAKQQKK